MLFFSYLLECSCIFNNNGVDNGVQSLRQQSFPSMKNHHIKSHEVTSLQSGENYTEPHMTNTYHSRQKEDGGSAYSREGEEEEEVEHPR